MPRIRPTTPDVRRQYRDQLPSEQRRVFDRLARLIDAPGGDLAWHREVGGLVILLRPRHRSGTGWARTLARALGPSDGLLVRCLHHLYPTPEDLERLGAFGVTWTQVWLTFAVRDRKQRHALLRQAVAGRWTDRQLRLTAQQRFPSHRRGVGGRPRKPSTPTGPRPPCASWAGSAGSCWTSTRRRGPG